MRICRHHHHDFAFWDIDVGEFPFSEYIYGIKNLEIYFRGFEFAANFYQFRRYFAQMMLTIIKYPIEKRLIIAE